MHYIQPKTIVLADEMPLVREGIAAALESTPRYLVVDQSGDGDTALKAIVNRRPDFAILDAHMRPAGAMDILRETRNSYVQTKFLLLSGRAQDRKMMLAAFRAGASAVLPKSVPTAHLLDALDQVGAGATYLSPLLNFRSTRTLAPRFYRDPYETLSSRELQVFELLVEGLRAKDIAVRLSLSPKTVDSHRASLMRKLDIHDMPTLVKYAIQRNLTSIA